MNKIRILDFEPKTHYKHLWAEEMVLRSMAKIEFMTITEGEAEDNWRLREVQNRMLREHWVHMKFIVVPNGRFLPVPISHYASEGRKD